jgi:hypothetical protein
MSNPHPGAPVRKFHALKHWSEPRSGHCRVIKDAWWLVDQDGNPIVHGKHKSPQCNSDRRITEHLAKLSVYQGLGFNVKQLSTVFLPVNPNDF